MHDRRLRALDEQGRKLGAAFAREEAPAPRRSRRTRWLVAAPIAAVVVLALVLVGAFRGEAGGGLSLDEAVAAVAKAAFDAPTTRPGQTVYAHSRTTGTNVGYTMGIGTYLAKHQSDIETWYAGGKKGWIRWTSEPLVFATAKDRAIYLKVSGNSRGARRMQRRDMSKHEYVCYSVVATRTSAPTDAASRLSLPRGTEIPTDPSAVYRLIRDHSTNHYVGVGGDAQRIWFAIEYAMQGGGLKLEPAQRAAVVQAIGKVPGVRTLGMVKDPNGVPSIGFERSFDDGRRRSRVFFDATTAMTTYFDETISKVQPAGNPKTGRPVSGYFGAPVGTVVQKYEMLDYRYLDSMPKLKVTDTPVARQYCPELRHQKPRK